MEPFQFHIYVCTQHKPEGAPACPALGGDAIPAALEKELKKAGLESKVQVTTCGCLGLCGKGPNMVIYPEGIWYSGVTPDLIPGIVNDHLINNQPVDAHILKYPETVREDILAHKKIAAMMKETLQKAGTLPEELTSFMRSFMESRIALTAIELDLFSAVGQGETAAGVAEKINTDPRATEALMNALAAITLLKKGDQDVFTNSPLAEDYLTKGAVHDSRTAAMHSVGLWHRWSTLTDCVKKGTSVALERGETRDEAGTKAFIAAMHKNAVFRAEKTVEQLDLDNVKQILDLGGGSGAYAMAFVKKSPDIKATVFDLPTVVPLTEQYVAEAGLSDRIEFMTGDMIADPLGNDYDLVWISAICHMFGADENKTLLKKAHACLNPGGRVIIQDFILDENKTAPRFGAVFALNMLVNTKGGSSYSRPEYTEWLEGIGFSQVSFLPLPGPTDLIIGKK